MGQMTVLLRGAAVLSGVDPKSLVDRDRRVPLVRARAAVVIAARGMGWTWEAIGAGLGGRHHSGLLRCARRHGPAVVAQAAALAVLAESLEGRAR